MGPVQQAGLGEVINPLLAGASTGLLYKSSGERNRMHASVGGAVFVVVFAAIPLRCFETVSQSERFLGSVRGCGCRSKSRLGGHEIGGHDCIGRSPYLFCRGHSSFSRVVLAAFPVPVVDGVLAYSRRRAHAPYQGRPPMYLFECDEVEFSQSLTQYMRHHLPCRFFRTSPPTPKRKRAQDVWEVESTSVLPLPPNCRRMPLDGRRGCKPVAPTILLASCSPACNFTILPVSRFPACSLTLCFSKGFR